MKEYYKQLFEHEYWANLKVLETLISAKERPKRAIEIFSHLIAAQRIWIDRVLGNQTDVKVWEVFEVEIMLELLEFNYSELEKIIEKQDLKQLISYENSKGEAFTNIISEVLSHLLLHSAYHRGQIVLLLKPHSESLPTTDYIFYLR